MKARVIICGLGHVGFRCFELLDALGFKVAIITETTSPDWQRRVEESASPYIHCKKCRFDGAVPQ
jgi:phosphoglycerate dehydrogenase-like enzyme